MRSTREVLDHHLACRRADDLETDLLANYDRNVVLLSYEGVHHGHEGVRTLASILSTYVRTSDYSYDQLVVEGDYALLHWSACGEHVTIHDGVDSFVVRNGLITVQTIHFSTRVDRSTPGGRPSRPLATST
jgi:hypothetical protein